MFALSFSTYLSVLVMAEDLKHLNSKTRCKVDFELLGLLNCLLCLVFYGRNNRILPKVT